MRVYRGYSHEEVAETVASQDAHERMHSDTGSFFIGLPVALHVLNEHACSQEKEKEFETKKGDEDVHKVAINARECAKMLSENNVAHRWMSMSPGRANEQES